MAHVLVVEDDEDLRELVAGRLATLGLTVSQAGNAADALAVVTAAGDVGARLDLAVLDVNMPGGMNGLQLCRELRRQTPTARAGIIMLTAMAGATAIEAAWKAGADDYMVKPYRVAELVERVRALLARHGIPAGS